MNRRSFLKGTVATALAASISSRAAEPDKLILSAPLTHSDWMLKPGMEWGEAGVRVIMLTGDHPSTARAIAGEAGLLIPGHDTVLRAADLEDLPAEELGRRLEGVAVVARATPLDKV